MVITRLPLVCAATLHALEDSLEGERTLCRNFVCRYVGMWPGRFDRIHKAITAGHHQDAMDSALSLRSSAMMVGAAQLSERTSNLISALETGCNAVAVKQLTALRKCGNQTAAQLTSSYVNAA